MWCLMTFTQIFLRRLGLSHLNDFEKILEKNLHEDKNFFSEENNFTEKLQPIGQVALCYIVAQSDSDLYVVDQHAAHERILFDKC